MTDQPVFITASGMSRLLGAGYFAAMARLKPDITWIYDCEERTGEALAALREGVANIAVAKTCKTPALVDLASKYGARIFTEDDWR